MKKKVVWSFIWVMMLIVVSGGVQAATKISSGTEGDYNYDVYEEKDGTRWVSLTKYIGKDTEVIVPSTIGGIDVKQIGRFAFKNCELTSINIPDKVIKIYGGAFEFCNNLLNVQLPKNLIQLGDDPIIEDNGIYYGDSIPVFHQCTSLKKIFLPKTIKEAFCAFEGCNNLEEVVLELGLERIPWGIFSSCKSEKLNIKIPNTVIEIAGYAFSYTNISHITLPQSVCKIGNGAFSNCQSLKEIIIPKGVEEGTKIFEDCKNLNLVTLENGMESIPRNMFVNCLSKNLNIIIPDSVKTIKYRALADHKISQIVIPSSVTNVEWKAFSGLTQEQIINFKSSESISDGFDHRWNDSCKAKIVWNYVKKI